MRLHRLERIVTNLSKCEIGGNRSPSSQLDEACEFFGSKARFQFDWAGMRELSDLPALEAQFVESFGRDWRALANWAAKHGWRPQAIGCVQVIISGRHRISKSLVPAWMGKLGCMYFPAWRVAERKAAIAHELAHVFFPNANRFLAEGLALHLQAELGGNPAFPNFGRSMHVIAREILPGMLASAPPNYAERGVLSDMESIATPSPLQLRIGANFYGEDKHGQEIIYPIVGSFTSFLAETRGLSMFQALYNRTPLQPGMCAVARPERWLDVYGLTVGELEKQWRTMLVRGDAGAIV